MDMVFGSIFKDIELAHWYDKFSYANLLLSFYCNF